MGKVNSIFKSFFLGLVVTFCVAEYEQVHAQTFYSKTEFGFQLGASTYFGDLNPNLGMRYIHPAGGLFFREYVNPYIALKAMVNYTQVEGSDANSTNPFRKARNLSFKSNIVELAVVSEFNFFRFETGDKHHRFTPYLSGGIGVFHYDPYVDYQGQRYSLRAMGTEGQKTAQYKDRKYSPFSICFPVGAGIRYWIRPGMNFSFEVLNRFTLTDYLDDVSKTYVGANYFSPNPANPTIADHLQDPSIPVDGQRLGRAGKQRGDSSTKDQYLMANFTISIQLKTYKCPANRFDDWYGNR